ncbi:ABC transporter substrate-binding protein [Pengzhenrongella frigida]|uniref:Extracellular solute-binding protein n=1 Tax=Pengzhenrongella frigida TaxID=1259133 RepID=A0A4Q5N897_9MICO|nr:extracellular solute-binding protein [Cellulomonas sp. HLT2-17]RYV52971.1 extracellular solute-binding protein [Cellulomonas sp. HLT2-17]
MSVSPVRLLAATVAAAALALTSGCAPGANTAEPSAASSGPVSVDVAAMGEITLTVWDQEVRGSQNDEIEALNAAFQEKYPNITIDRNAQSFDDLAKTLRLALSGSDAPDVVEANNSRSQMGAFVEAGQIVSLEPYAEAYGWRDRYPESVLGLSSYSADATTFGSGNLYGLPQMGEIVGVYYNKAKLAALGLAVPTTWAEFTDQLAVAKAAGETPLALGDLEKWPAIHVFGPIQGAHTPADQVRALALGNPGGDWTDATNTAAATELSEWVSAGYLNEDVLGSKYDDVVARFGEGTGVFLLAGSWNTAALDPVMGDNLGFFAPPPAVAGDAPSTTGGTSLPFTVTSASEHPDAGAAYIDFLTSDDAMKVLAETGNLPVLGSAALAPTSGGGKDVYAAYELVTTEGNLLPYLDYATPTFSDTLGAALQDLLAGKQTPEQFTQTLQADYGAFVGE